MTNQLLLIIKFINFLAMEGANITEFQLRDDKSSIVTVDGEIEHLKVLKSHMQEAQYILYQNAIYTSISGEVWIKEASL